MTTGLTFKTSLALLGGINVQASIASVVASQKISTVVLTDSSIRINPNTPIIQLGQVLKSPLLNIAPPFVSTILPAYKSPTILPPAVDTRLQNKEQGPDVRYTAYEQLTGVSKIRPEILLLTGFQPIFDAPPTSIGDTSGQKDTTVDGLNPIGEFLDAQVQLQHLRLEAMSKLISDMRSNPDVGIMLDMKTSEFKMYLADLNSEVNYLYNVVVTLESLKQKIDIKNAKGLSYENMVSRFFSDIKQYSATPLFDITSLNNISFQSVLTDLGFNSNNIQSFSSTKVFLQCLFEMNSLIKGNSYNILGISPQDQSSDSNGVYINKHSPKGFSFAPTNVKTVSQYNLSVSSRVDVLTYVNTIKNTYDTLFSTTNFQSVECRIAFLCNFLSNEFVFSRSLSDASTRTFISNNYGYPISDTFSNSQLFDVVFGDIGDKIIDRTDNLSVNSVSTIANKIVDDVAILPFENDFIEFEQSVHSPGSSYFIDKIFELANGSYNTQNMQSFSGELDGHLKRFTEFLKRMSFVPTTARKFQGFITGHLGLVLGTPKSFFENAVYSFVEQSTGQALSTMMASALPAVFNIAQKDNYLKSLLFVYVYMQTYGANLGQTSSQTMSIIIQQIDDRVNGKLSDAAAQNSQLQQYLNIASAASPGGLSNIFNTANVPTVTSRDAITNELLTARAAATTPFLAAVFNLFRNVFDAFSTSASMTTDGSTRFNHIQDTTLMLMVFDMIVSVVATYVPKQFVSQFSTNSQASIGKTFYNVSSKVTDLGFAIGRQNDSTTASSITLRNPVSINTVKSKLDFETNSLVKLPFMLLSGLASMKDSIDSTYRSLNGGSFQLQKIINILGDTKLLALATSEQQILLVKSMFDDISDKINIGGQITEDSLSVNSELSSSGYDDIAILDDAVISNDIKTAIFTLMANEKFSSSAGKNIRILTVGIPVGMASNLKQKVLLDKIDKDTFSQKQVDIIRVNAFKVDLEHQDLVFKPQSFLFEMSRFVPRTGLGIAPISPGFTIEQVLDAIPTRDYSVLSNAAQVTDSSSLQSSDYDFLTSDQKLELPRNHAMSYLLEVYIRLLTGITPSETDMTIDPSLIPNVIADQTVIDAAVDHIVSKATGNSVTGVTSLNNLLTTQKTDPSVASDVQKLYQQLATLLSSYAPVVDTLKRSKTHYTYTDVQAKSLFIPKLFDRIFSIAVDPDDYEIDVVETLKTSAGKESFDKLLKQGMIVEISDQSTFFASTISTTRYKLRERDINENDLTFEKYFITFDTVFDEVL